MLLRTMDKYKSCKVCSRKFSSGKALGGHMRSHLMPLPPKTPPQDQDSGGHSESTLSLYSSENQEEEEEEIQEKNLGYGLRENPRKSFRIVDPEFLEDQESDTEPTRKSRSKRNGKMQAKDCSLSYSKFSDEDIAMCLMKLSKDTWTSRNDTNNKLELRKKQRKYQCDICNKVFKCSQALGSHKLMHKKRISEGESLQEKQRQVSVQHNLHECPFCGKIFGSAQALGRHKSSHILSTSTTECSSLKLGDSLMVSNFGKFPSGFIDLNMPAPMEDEEYFYKNGG